MAVVILFKKKKDLFIKKIENKKLFDKVEWFAPISDRKNVQIEGTVFML